jgi:hypothetical protein
MKWQKIGPDVCKSGYWLIVNINASMYWHVPSRRRLHFIKWQVFFQGDWQRAFQTLAEAKAWVKGAIEEDERQEALDMLNKMAEEAS